MKYLIKCKDQTAYEAYMAGNDIWLPRVSYIVNKGASATSDDKYSNNGPSRIDFSRLGTEFIQVANGGIMYFTDQVIDNVKYTAEVESDTLVIKTVDLTTGQYTNNAYIDDENNAIVVNYPTGTVSYSL